VANDTAGAIGGGPFPRQFPSVRGVVCVVFFMDWGVASAEVWPSFFFGDRGFAVDHPSFPQAFFFTSSSVFFSVFAVTFCHGMFVLLRDATIRFSSFDLAITVYGTSLFCFRNFC